MKLFLSFVLSFFSLTAMGYEPVTYSEAEFLKLKNSGAKVVVDVAASWCPTCKRQQKDLKQVSMSSELKGVTFMKLDYDNKKDVKAFSKLINRPIPRQSTIAVFKDKKLAAFSVAETGESLQSSLKKVLK